MSGLTGILISYAVFYVGWYILMSIGCRGEFKKAGISAGLAFIPLYREVILFNISWKKPKMGLVWIIVTVLGAVSFLVGCMIKLQFLAWLGAALLIAAIVLMIIRDSKQSHAFGRKGGTTAGLILLNPLFNLIIGRSESEYKEAV